MLCLYKCSQRDFCNGEPHRSAAGAEEWELPLFEFQALLCPCVILWYIRLVHGQLMKWPAWHLAHAKGWALNGRVQIVQGSPPSMQVMGKAIARLQCPSLHKDTPMPVLPVSPRHLES